MIREAYETLKVEEPSPIHAVWSDYRSLTQVEPPALRERNDAIGKFITDLKIRENDVGNSIDEFTNRREWEMWYDLSGKRRLLTGHFGGLLELTEAMILDCLSAPINKYTTFVTGHLQPDADTIVSSLFKAVGRIFLSPLSGNAMPYIKSLPPEVQLILGPTITHLHKVGPTNGSNEDLLHQLGDCNNIVLVDTHMVHPTH